MSTTDAQTAERTGHCLCGSISYRFDKDPELVVVCHCGHCQRSTGSAFSLNVLVQRDAVEITGTPKSFQTVGTENGNLRDRLFCGDCGTPIFTVLHEQPGILIVKGGTLDDPSKIEPAVEVWGRRAQDWVRPSPERTRFAGDAQ